MKYLAGLFLAILLSLGLSSQATLAATDTTTQPVAEIEQQANQAAPTYDGITVTEPTITPSAIRLFWRNLMESASLTFTFDPNKKAELAMKFADEHMLSAKNALASSDKKTKEQGKKELEHANKLMEKVEASQEKALENPTKDTERLLKNRVVQIQKQQELLDQIETTTDKDDQSDVLNLREKFADKSQALINAIENDKIPEDVKAKLEELKTKIEAHRAEIKDAVTQMQTLKDAAKNGDEEATAKLEELKSHRLEEVKKAIEARQENLQTLQEKVQSIKDKAEKGNKKAKELLKKIEESPELQSKLEEIDQKIQEHQQKLEEEKVEKPEDKPKTIRAGEPNPSTTTVKPDEKQSEPQEVKSPETEKPELERE